MIQPPRVGPTIGAAKTWRSFGNNVIAMLCFSTGNASSNMLWLPRLQWPPPANPWITRNRISWPRLPASPHKSELRVNIAIDL